MGSGEVVERVGAGGERVGEGNVGRGWEMGRWGEDGERVGERVGKGWERVGEGGERVGRGWEMGRWGEDGEKAGRRWEREGEGKLGRMSFLSRV